jgi:hypothetical protein
LIRLRALRRDLPLYDYGRAGKRVLVVDRRKKSEISFAQNRPVQ